MSEPPRFSAASDIGLVRSNNEDAYLASPPLFAVADGMGGHKAGEVASAGAIRILAEMAHRDSDSLLAAVKAANEAVFAEAVANPELAGMGTTITAMIISGRSVQIVHVGDSRAYLLRDHRLRRLTQDHTVVERLAREGKISHEEVDRHPQRSVLERALGVAPEVDIDVQLLDVRTGDRLLLCTDGLSSMLDDAEIRAILDAEADPPSATSRLLQAALGAGGKDNVTALVVDFPRAAGDGPDPDATAEQPAVLLAEPPTGPTPRRRSKMIPSHVVAENRAAERVAPPAPAGPPGMAPGRRVGAPGRHPGAWTPPPGAVTSPGKPAPAGPAAGATVGPSRGAAGMTPGGPGRLAPPRRRRGRLLIGVAAVVVLVLLGAGAGLAAARSSWYVGQKSGNVAIFQGVPGSFAGIRLSWLASTTDVSTAGLPAYSQEQVQEGITAGNRQEAERTVANLRGLRVTPTVGVPDPSLVSPAPTPLPPPPGASPAVSIPAPSGRP